MHRWASFFYTPFFLFSLFLTVKYFGLQLLVFHNANPLDCLIAAVPSLLLFLLPIELGFRRRKLLAYLCMNAVLSAAMLAVVVYYRQFGIIVTYHAFTQAHQVIDVSDSILDLLQPLYLLFFLDIAIYFALKWLKLTPALNEKPFIPKSALVGGLAGSLLTLNSYAYTHGDILNEMKQAERMGLISYQVHKLVTGVRSDIKSAAMPPLTQGQIRSVKGIAPIDNPKERGAAEGRHLIVVQLESFQNFLIGMELGGREVTPVLNDLIEESYYFSNVYQQIGQGNTSDAEFIMNTSFYPPAQQAASQLYGGKRLPSLPRLLSEKGYETVTLHTNEVEFWEREDLYPALGFDRYLDKAYFGEEDLIAFGASDEVLYRKSMDVFKELDASGNPFYAHVIAMSPHHPFLPPETKEMLSLPEEWEGTDIGNYVKMTNYADRALGMFIESLKREGLWDRSMLVVYGDHFGVSSYNLKGDERELLEAKLGHEYDLRTVHNIPLVITIPGVTNEGAEFSGLGGQVDIMPTVTNLLGISLNDHLHFGQDLLNTDDNVLGSRFYLPTGSFLNNEIMYISGETFGEGTVIPLTAGDPILEGDPLLYRDDFVTIMRLLEMNDAYLTALPER